MDPTEKTQTMKTFTITASRSDTPALTICIDAETADEAFDYATIRFLEVRGADASEIIIDCVDEAR